MATIVPTLTKLNGDDSVIKVTWATMLKSTDDAGTPVRLTDWADRSVQVTGTLGTGGSVRLEGSNDGGTTYHALSDPQGNALDINALKIEAITEICELVRPRVTAGDANTSLNVYLILRRQQPLRT